MVPLVAGWAPCRGHGWPPVGLGHFDRRPWLFCEFCPPGDPSHSSICTFCSMATACLDDDPLLSSIHVARHKGLEGILVEHLGQSCLLLHVWEWQEPAQVPVGQGVVV